MGCSLNLSGEHKRNILADAPKSIRNRDAPMSASSAWEHPRCRHALVRVRDVYVSPTGINIKTVSDMDKTRLFKPVPIFESDCHSTNVAELLKAAGAR